VAALRHGGTVALHCDFEASQRVVAVFLIGIPAFQHSSISAVRHSSPSAALRHSSIAALQHFSISALQHCNFEASQKVVGVLLNQWFASHILHST
jgi:hypothetical protein